MNNVDATRTEAVSRSKDTQTKQSDEEIKATKLKDADMTHTEVISRSEDVRSKQSDDIN